MLFVLGNLTATDATSRVRLFQASPDAASLLSLLAAFEEADANQPRHAPRTGGETDPSADMTELEHILTKVGWWCGGGVTLIRCS